ncbi:hypothetical protein BDM02DRAFT_3193640 [Thelephora ganbajun]|uniref:Uncharacterized protein n=1 Tax=Thelephora ganbajun TaxID=370292 RepID=A0ACB6YXT4_THEGA|nr:hypothetical protein BDM02DRAFT_3193640 [Thelephora ganbajun]
MRFAAAISERLLTRLEVLEGQVTTQANALQLQVSGLDSLLTRRSEDRQFLLSWNAALEREVEELKQLVTRLEGEFGVLLARVEALEWVTPSEYLSVENLLASGVDDIQEMDAEVAVDTSEPLFPHLS